MRGAALAVGAGGLILAWPAFLNGFPILAADSAAILSPGGPPIYAALATLFHARVTLWGVALAQGVVLSHLLWLLARFAGRATPARHVALCAAAALGTSLPWVAALVAPDALLAAGVLAAALLGWGWAGLSRPARAWCAALAVLGLATGPAGLAALAGATLAAGLLRQGGVALRLGLAGAGAALLLLGAQALAPARAGPDAAVVVLARLLADGPAARTLEARCPEALWNLCAAAGAVPTDSQRLLRDPESPLRGTNAAEARAILGATLGREPLTVLAEAAGNAAAQVFRAGIGGTLAQAGPGREAAEALRRQLGPAEAARYAASLQARDVLRQEARSIAWVPPLLALLAAPLLALWSWRAWHAGDRARAGLAAGLLGAFIAHAAATGALAAPLDRHGARLAWLLPIGALLLARPPSAGRPVEGYQVLR